MQSLERLDRKEISDADRSGICDAAKVVAHQVDDHQIFGTVFYVGRKRVARLRVGFECAGPRSVPFIGRV